MTINQVIQAVDGMKPHSFSEDVLTMWINELEGMVQTDIFLIAHQDIVTYTYDNNKDSELLVKAPHSKIYVYYLAAMIDFANNDYDKYANTMDLFNKFYADYMRWYALTVNPASGRATVVGYYLSAYGIAVQHGYAGTEEEWLRSLRGERGPQGDGWVVRGYADTVDDLPLATSGLTDGIVYAVGNEEPYVYYVWTLGVGWVSHGPMSANVAKEYFEKAQTAAEAASSAQKTAEDESDLSHKAAVLSESWAVGGTGAREGEDTNNAKYYADKARESLESSDSINELFCNALKGTESGRNAVRLDDVSPIKQKIEASVSRINLLDGPFSPIVVENGKTYTMSIHIAEGYSIPADAEYYLCWYGADGGWRNNSFINGGAVISTEMTFTAGADGDYGYYIEAVNITTDAFLGVQLEEGNTATAYAPPVKNIEEVKVKTYGKNLSTINWEFTVQSRKATAINVPCDVTLSMYKTSGTVLVYESNDNFATFTNIKTFGATVNNCELQIVKEVGYEYRIAATSAGVQDIEWIQTEVGPTATGYERYIEPVSGAVAISPTTTIVSDTEGVKVTVPSYNKDINGVIAKIESAIANL